MIDRSPDSDSDIDALLRATLADDLPPAVEDRLNEQVERFLASRRPDARSSRARWAWIAPWQAGLTLRAAASAGLLACGIVLHADGGAHMFAASAGRMQESVALWNAIRRAPSVACTGAVRDELRSPAEFADRVYESWVLVGAQRNASDAIVLTFRSPADAAQYELVVDHRSMLPRRVVRTPLQGAAPLRSPAGRYDATCTWGPQTPKE